MHVGKPTFSDFDGVNVAESVAKRVVPRQFIDQGRLIHVEHADCQVRSISY
jgi:hypothetical protein